MDAGSLRENLLLESFQLLSYYLGNVLYTLLPTLEQAARFRQVRRGAFSNLEEPEKGLRCDKTVRNLNLHTFSGLRTLVLKQIMKLFRERAEKLLD